MKSRAVPFLLTAVFLAAIFLLPYHVPVSGPSASQSWEFGYNNTLAQLLIALLLVILFAWHQYARDVTATSPLFRALGGTEKAESNQTLWITMAGFQIGSVTLISLWYQILPYTYYGEFTYFSQRVEAMILGQKPYVDFTFNYGPWMLAPPAWIYHAFDGQLSEEFCYLLVLLLHFVLGLALLAYIVSRLKIARGKALLFALIVIPGINITMGLNYTPLRFALAPASLFAVGHLVELTRTARVSRLWLFALVFLVPILNFSISPEMGLACTIACIVYFFWFLLGHERPQVVLLLPLLAGLAATFLLFPWAYFLALIQPGEAPDFPIFPTVHIVFFLAMAFWFLPRIGLLALSDKSGTGPFCAGLAILLGLLILPATGRCDSGHIYFNSLGLFLVGFAGITWLAPKWQWLIFGLYFLIFPVINEITFWDHYQDQIADVLKQRIVMYETNGVHDNYEGLAPGAVRPPIHYSKLLTLGTWLKQLPEEKIGTPLGVDEVTERYLILTRRNVSEFFLAPYGGLSSVAQLPRKFADMEKMPYVLVPERETHYLDTSNPAGDMQAQGEADEKFLTGLLLFPVHLQVVHPLFLQQQPVMQHIVQTYEPVARLPNGILFKRKL